LTLQANREKSFRYTRPNIWEDILININMFTLAVCKSMNGGIYATVLGGRNCTFY